LNGKGQNKLKLSGSGNECKPLLNGLAAAGLSTDLGGLSGLGGLGGLSGLSGADVSRSNTEELEDERKELEELSPEVGPATYECTL
jgi:hypothetical protein